MILAKIVEKQFAAVKWNQNQIQTENQTEEREREEEEKQGEKGD